MNGFVRSLLAVVALLPLALPLVGQAEYFTCRDGDRLRPVQKAEA